jgi:hydrogenase maturation factor HypF (carbamoyltransferase family)
MINRKPIIPIQNNTTERKVGFSDVNKEVIATRGVKLRNKEAEKREAEKLEKEQYKERFEKAADQRIQDEQDTNARALNTVSKFMKMFENKMLNKNKTDIALNVEREIKQELIKLITDLNNDETTDEYGTGSVVAISILLKIVLNLRDRMNDLEYENVQLKKSLSK